jgi:phosphatidate cytidylyltransferase
MITRVVTALIMICILVPCLLFGGWYYLAAMIVMSVACVFEFVNAPSKGRYSILIFIIAFVAEAFLMYSPFFFVESTRNAMFNENTLMIDRLFFSPLEVIAYFVCLFVYSILSEKFTATDASYLFSMGLYIGFTYVCMMFLRYLPNSGNYQSTTGVLYKDSPLASSLLADFTVIGSVSNDVFAYFTGVLFGEHKMSPRVSPHKTWEGFAGGYIFAAGLALLFSWLCEFYGFPILPGIISWSGGNWWRILVLSLLMPLAGTLGDLLFSLIKRNYAIKDYSNILPGHGGALDRIDGLSLICILNSFIIVLFLYGWKSLL